MGEKPEAGCGFPKPSAPSVWPALSCFRFFPRQQKYVDYVMREFQRKEMMRTSQYRLRFHLPMRIIPL